LFNIGTDANVNGTNNFFIYDNVVGVNRVIVSDTGNMGIGTTAPAYKLEVIGDINAVGNVRANGVVLTSDSRFKENVTEIGTSTAEKLSALNPVSYTWNELGQTKGGKAGELQYGFLAQEVEQIFPSLVVTGADGYKSVNYIAMIPMIVEAVQEIVTKIDGFAKEFTMEKLCVCTNDDKECITKDELRALKSGNTNYIPQPVITPTPEASTPTWSDTSSTTAESVVPSTSTTTDPVVIETTPTTTESTTTPSE
jgi:hypothetical protein